MRRRARLGQNSMFTRMTKEQVAAADAMVNMDTLGLAPTEIWMSHSDKQLIKMLAQVAKATNLPVTGMDVDQVGTTDSEQFAKRNIPRITVHSLTQEPWNAGILHTNKKIRFQKSRSATITKAIAWSRRTWRIWMKACTQVTRRRLAALRLIDLPVSTRHKIAAHSNVWGR